MSKKKKEKKRHYRKKKLYQNPFRSQKDDWWLLWTFGVPFVHCNLVWRVCANARTCVEFTYAKSPRQFLSGSMKNCANEAINDVTVNVFHTLTWNESGFFLEKNVFFGCQRSIIRSFFKRSEGRKQRSETLKKKTIFVASIWKIFHGEISSWNVITRVERKTVDNATFVVKII